MVDNSLIGLIERSFRDNWETKALSDASGLNLRYKDVARKVEKMHLIFSSCELKRGDRVALCGTHNINWGIIFLSVISYGCVVVFLDDSAKDTQIYKTANASGAKLLFADAEMIDGLNEKNMPEIMGIILMNDFFLAVSRNEKLSDTCNHLNEYFCKKYPANFRKSDISYRRESNSELIVINGEGEEITYGALLHLMDTDTSKSLLQRLSAALFSILFSGEKERKTYLT